MMTRPFASTSVGFLKYELSVGNVMLSNSWAIESSTACEKSARGGPSSVSTARIALRLTAATTALVGMKFLHRSEAAALGILRESESPGAGTAAAPSWPERRGDSAEIPVGKEEG